MSDLRSLFPDTRFNPTYSANTFSTMYVYNTNVDSVTNGGRCCLWTVPAGVTWAKFEVWGGGGDGGGACCCQQPAKGGGSGSYARKTTRVVPGQTYTLCAGGSGCCSQNNCGSNGFPSYACGGTTYGICLCASGGEGGASCCWAAIGGNYHCSSNICGSACGYDLAICGIQGSAHQSWCGYDSWTYLASGPVIGSGSRISRTHCGEFWMGCDAIGGHAGWPGGGGGTAMSYGGCCWGGWGAGGLVIVTYK